MNWRTNSLALSLRNMGRRLGLNSFLMSFVRSDSYEDKFNKVLLACVQKNDVVWDVGANIGHYTKLFADLAGSQGKIFAFEPSPQNYKRLALNLQGVENVVLLPCGLGDKEESVAFMQGEDDLGWCSCSGRVRARGNSLWRPLGKIGHSGVAKLYQDRCRGL